MLNYDAQPASNARFQSFVFACSELCSLDTRKGSIITSYSVRIMQAQSAWNAVRVYVSVSEIRAVLKYAASMSAAKWLTMIYSERQDR